MAAATRAVLLAGLAGLVAVRVAAAQPADDEQPTADGDQPTAGSDQPADGQPAPGSDQPAAGSAEPVVQRPTGPSLDDPEGPDRAPLAPDDQAVRVDLGDVPMTDRQIIGADAHPWKVEDLQFRTSYLSQYGHGYQSQDGTLGSPGSEAMNIIEPWTMFTLRQNDHIVHQVMLPVDVLTHASPNVAYWAYNNPDAITSASRHNVSGDIDVRTTITHSETETYNTRVKFHAEEPLASGLVGAGYVRHLADDNATLGVDANLTVDGFDKHDDKGTYLGKTNRETYNANISASQLLSPTTVVDGIYAVTYQHGTLDPSGWNAVPLSNANITSERFPGERFRQAWAARIAQNIPWTRTTLKLWYRYYIDDFQVHAHTVELDGYQYLLPWLYVRGSYRFHTQTAVDFFTTRLMLPISVPYYTSDSDLAAFDANEWSAQLVIVQGKAPVAIRKWRLSAEIMKYWRTNDLNITVVSLSAGRSFL